MLTFADGLRQRGAGLRVLNLGGGDVDTSTPMGSMVFTSSNARWVGFTSQRAGAEAAKAFDQPKPRHGLQNWHIGHARVLFFQAQVAPREVRRPGTGDLANWNGGKRWRSCSNSVRGRDKSELVDPGVLFPVGPVIPSDDSCL
jgi:hypothetical protein